MQERRQVLFYHLGTDHMTNAAGQPNYSWPYEISYAPDYKPREFYLAEGDARNGNGGFFPAATVLEAQWRSHLKITGALWLLPILEHMARGELVAPDEILLAYEAEHGHAAPNAEQTLYWVD